MQKVITSLFLVLGLSFLMVGCANKALPQSRAGTISESYSGVVQMAEAVQVKGDGKWTTMGGLVAGGVVGHQFGSGSGQSLLTMGGAVLGSMLGADADVREGQRLTIEFDSGKRITTILPIDSNNPVRYQTGDRVTVYITNGKVTEIR
ncbi:MAG: glycine zipper 2TM domain-containing protein [Epsilonproteobacteria bacterium]|nr:glycine zipper 2TM domain-containing protein [Campylobacterota bacterium]